MSIQSAPLNASLCPLCGQANLCAMEIEKATGKKQGACWCVGIDFSADLLSRVPTDKKDLACICQRCASQQNSLSVPDKIKP